MAARSPELRRQIAAAGGHARHRTADADTRLAALAERRIADYIRKTVDSAPPLTSEQRDRLAALLAAPTAPEQPKAGAA